jgi:hypothetical protein
MGRPRYVKGMDPMSQPKVAARVVIFSWEAFIGYICDFA